MKKTLFRVGNPFIMSTCRPDRQRHGDRLVAGRWQANSNPSPSLIGQLFTCPLGDVRALPMRAEGGIYGRMEEWWFCGKMI